MIVLGIDIGNKTRTALNVMSSDDYTVYYYNTVLYKDSKTPLEHRKKIVEIINSLIIAYDIDYISFEKINLFSRGSVSHLDNILSLCRLQTTIIDNFSDNFKIRAIFVKTWKARVLGNGNGTKEDAFEYVSKLYPEMDLQLKIWMPRKKEFKVENNYDLADSICISRFSIDHNDLLEKYKMNYV
jgi:Holliday junction resolvasome RuvABC endonuclease subunit